MSGPGHRDGGECAGTSVCLYPEQGIRPEPIAQSRQPSDPPVLHPDCWDRRYVAPVDPHRKPWPADYESARSADDALRWRDPECCWGVDHLAADDSHGRPRNTSAASRSSAVAESLGCVMARAAERWLDARSSAGSGALLS